MNIALLGYGRMGQITDNVARRRKHNIVAKIGAEDSIANYTHVDVAIDFSIPSVAFKNIVTCFKNNIPIVSGTTGWLDQYEEAVAICKQEKGAFVYSSNFSIGVNVFFELNEFLAKMMSKLSAYQPNIEEIHHIQKQDAPSGTAITLAEGLIKHHHKTAWKLAGETSDSEITIDSKRIGKVPGTHIVNYVSTIDSIEIKHRAHNREGFALGAVVAAEWILGKKGVFGMKDVLKIYK